MPDWLNSLRLRWRALIKRTQLERDLHDEMAFHLAMREAKERQAGVPIDQARLSRTTCSCPSRVHHPPTRARFGMMSVSCAQAPTRVELAGSR